MLRSEHSIVRYEGGLAWPDRIETDARSLELAASMIEVYRAGIGETRCSLHRTIDRLLPGEKRRAGAFAKLLDEAAVFDTDREGRSARLRGQVFKRSAGAACRAEEMKTEIAGALGRPWEEIEAALYADLRSRHRLQGTGMTEPRSLLSRYNVAQAQAALYRAERLRIEATRDFKSILRHAKLARLLHRIQRRGLSRYTIDLSGPASVLKPTTRYGVNMARFLPALIACRGWSLAAVLRTPWGGKVRLMLNESLGLQSHIPPPPDFDSALEKEFAEAFGRERNGWHLLREAEILHDAQTTFIPDFVFRHSDGQLILFEIAGYWTTAYLSRKRAMLRRFHEKSMLVAFPEKLARSGISLPGRSMFYRGKVKPEQVVFELDKLRQEERL